MAKSYFYDESIADWRELVKGEQGEHGTSGKDGSNVLPTRIALVSEQQPDLLETARRRSPYNNLIVSPGEEGTLKVSSYSKSGDILTYTISSGDAYRIVSNITETSSNRGQYEYPPIDDTRTEYPQDYRSEFRLGGEWDTRTTWYTEEVGATWEADVITTTENGEVYVSTFADNRGGIWKIELLNSDVEPFELSTYSSEIGTSHEHVLTIPNPGSHTIRGTFIGADPDNPPNSSYAPRAWLRWPDNHPQYVLRVSETFDKSGELSTRNSNKNWAIRVSEVGKSAVFFPEHGNNVETITTPPRFYDGTQEIDLESLESSLEVNELTMVQHIHCHTTSVSDELVEVYTIDTFKKDGTYSAEGKIVFLDDAEGTNQMYFGMLPFNPAEFQKLVTSYRTEYDTSSEIALDTYSTNLGDDGIYSTSMALVGDNPDIVAAVRYNNPEETRRVSRNAVLPESYGQFFIEHRSTDFNKLYPRLGYENGDLIPQGTVLRFSVDYWFGRVPSIREVIV